MPADPAFQERAPLVPRSRLLPPFWFFLAIPLMSLLAWAIPGFVVLSWPWNLAGAVFILLGTVVALAGRRQFARAGTTIKPFQESSALVTSGVFAYSRNPIYASMVVVLIGIAMLHGVLTPFAVPFALAVLLQRGFIRHEERMLEDRFGDAYRAYVQQVRRWL